MSDKTFVDSNVLIYAYDADAGSKRTAARRSSRTCGPSVPECSARKFFTSST
jgi:predicted nucleic acid-binding protein